jgi:hypothetical protein
MGSSVLHRPTETRYEKYLRVAQQCKLPVTMGDEGRLCARIEKGRQRSIARGNK